MLKKSAYDLVLILLIVLENLFLFVFYQQHITSQAVNSGCYFAVSLLFGVVVLRKFYGTPEISVYTGPGAKKKYLLILLYALCFLLLNTLTISILKTTLYPDMSDIIPTIVTLSHRFISGDAPYARDALEYLGFNGPSNYLPMHWLPYTLSEIFRFDPRTVTFAIWCLGAFTIMFRSLRIKNTWIQLFVPVLLSGSYLLIVNMEHGIIGWTVETMVAGYYMLLIAGLNQKNFFLTGLIIGVCLLSRYYIVLWLPLWAFALFISNNKTMLFRTAIIVAAVLCVLYVIPFLSKDWSALYFSFKTYQNFPISEWRHLNTDKLPYHLYSGTGFAHLFYEKYSQADIMTGFRLLKKAFYLSIAVTISGLGMWYWFYHRKVNCNIFLLASFKIYLSVFLAFIMVPYLYLMITANFVSIAIFAEQARYRLGPEPLA